MNYIDRPSPYRAVNTLQLLKRITFIGFMDTNLLYIGRQQNREELDGLGMWHVWAGEGVYRVLVGKPEGKRPLGRPRRR